MSAWRIEPGRDADAEAILALLAEVFLEYDCVLDPVLDTIENVQPETRYSARGGAFFVARDADNRLIGTVAIHPSQPNTGQLRTMYLHRAWRGTGIAQALMERVLAWCVERGWTQMELWSDTRFDRGHAFYRKLGFVQTGHERALDDVNNTREYHFEAALADVKL